MFFQVASKDRVDELEYEVRELQRTVECEKCGCLLRVSTAVKGKGEIRSKRKIATVEDYWDLIVLQPLT